MQETSWLRILGGFSVTSQIKEMKTKVGIGISLKDNILFFSQPVKSIELSTIESIQLGNMLLGDSQKGVTAILRDLKRDGFFGQTRKLSDIKIRLAQENVHVESSSLNVLLKKLVNRGELERLGTKGNYTYNEVKK